MKMQWEAAGEGAPLVLAPGGLTGWLSWIPHSERLSETRKVVRVQLLSVQLGLDGRPLPDDYSPKTESAALANTLESLGLTPPVDFAGWSYGAEITLDFALDNPSWVRTLTIIEPSAYWVLPSLDAEAKRAIQEEQRLSREDITEDQLEAFIQRTAMAPPGRNPRDLLQWPLWARHRQSLRANPSIAEYKADRRRLPVFALSAPLVKGTGLAPILHRITTSWQDSCPMQRCRSGPAVTRRTSSPWSRSWTA
jgi:pimeloyl-ACP methyl ester carboxylesterase